MAGMTPELDMTEEQYAEVKRLLSLHLPGTEVWAYGSRAAFKARPQSDLDLVVFSSKAQRAKVYALKEAFEESVLPFRVDIFVWDDIPEYFRGNILSSRVVIQAKPDRPAFHASSSC